MIVDSVIGLDQLVAGLRAAGEPTRLRILALLAGADLTVKDLTTILGQSQPRISRHLKLLTDAGLIVRAPEGAWAYYRLTEVDSGSRLADQLLLQLDPSDPVLARDRERLAAVQRAHAEAAAAYFAANAHAWDAIRTLHVPEDAVEAAMRRLVGAVPFRSMLDLGTGTGRMLELFQDLYERGLGVDASAAMLSVARMNLANAQIQHARVRQGDIFALAMPQESYDLVTLHQVLHYLEDPASAIEEAARVLRPGGRLLVVDFAPHDLEFLRSEHAHRRLGFSHDQVSAWLAQAGLETMVVEDLSPERASPADLTVTLWLGRDTRLQTADAETTERLETTG
ncbi:ArsR/SmtB family transcription factor [Amorphus orientalis]|uniref:SAM-dependent methyltransferase n=1 Tax=Amorphus orientalis TaxID=649198 RepID=A0AAE4AVH5_9HYPH|nr:metalloregulator ArsR/SmtB family transcription factor [Amorphus orientalis]MDQ0316694.1 SAM-dependent methyltransferase [Amorphus orientalis]